MIHVPENKHVPIGHVSRQQVGHNRASAIRPGIREAPTRSGGSCISGGIHRDCSLYGNRSLLRMDNADAASPTVMDYPLGVSDRAAVREREFTLRSATGLVG